MPFYTSESLEQLRSRIDLVEVLSAHVRLKRSSGMYKALCPFHEERTPSFCVKAGGTHYHCFGCGAHGDAVAFLMSYMHMSFTDAVEMLAERFHVRLEREKGGSGERIFHKGKLKEALARAAEIYHGLLLFSEEAHPALEYLYQRGIDADFIRRFQIGYAPKGGDVLLHALTALGIDEPTMRQAGLLQQSRRRDFFNERIAFPICDATQAVIGFSCRKFHDGTYGGKYINTPETPLFKKSRVLFGLHASRMRIAKEKRALVVEGQIDALRLIHAGFDWTVAGQGTAFTEEHAKELVHLGVQDIYLAMDSDSAGHSAAVQIGDLFQCKGVNVHVLSLPDGLDPDRFLVERGPERFSRLVEEAEDYLPFFYRHLSRGKRTLSPAEKSHIVQTMATAVRGWEDPVLIHESLRTIAELAQVPESTIGVGWISLPTPVPLSARVQGGAIDTGRILEADLFRWLLLAAHDHPKLEDLILEHIREEHVRTPMGKRFLSLFASCKEKGVPFDALSLGQAFEEEEDAQFLQEIFSRKINVDKAKEGMVKTIEELLKRHWMEEKEAIHRKLTQEALPEEEVDRLVQAFAQLNQHPPKVHDRK